MHPRRTCPSYLKNSTLHNKAINIYIFFHLCPQHKRFLPDNNFIKQRPHNDRNSMMFLFSHATGSATFPEQKRISYHGSPGKRCTACLLPCRAVEKLPRQLKFQIVSLSLLSRSIFEIVFSPEHIGALHERNA